MSSVARCWAVGNNVFEKEEGQTPWKMKRGNLMNEKTVSPIGFLTFHFSRVTSFPAVVNFLA
jgi:hypothetical protein